MWEHESGESHEIVGILNKLEREGYTRTRIFMDSSDPHKQVVFHILAHKEDEKLPIDTGKGLYQGVYEAALAVRAARSIYFFTPFNVLGDNGKEKNKTLDRFLEEVRFLGDMNEVIIGLCE
jgi:ribonuclease HI